MLRLKRWAIAGFIQATQLWGWRSALSVAGSRQTDRSALKDELAVQ